MKRALRPKYYSDLDREKCKLLVSQFLKDIDSSFYRAAKIEPDDSIFVNQAQEELMKSNIKRENVPPKQSSKKKGRKAMSSISLCSSNSSMLSDDFNQDDKIKPAKSDFLEA